MRAAPEEEMAAVRSLAKDQGLGAVRPSLLKSAHRSTFQLAPLPLVAKVQSCDPVELALHVAKRELAVAVHLADEDAPAVRSSDAAFAGPHVLGRCVVTLWGYVDHVPRRKRSQTAAAALALRDVHAALASFESELPKFTDAFALCRELLANTFEMTELTPKNRAFLQESFRRLEAKLDAFNFDCVPLHGDAHLGNVLWTAAGPRWGDLEAACVGPIEWDVSALPREARRLFPEANMRLVDLLADLRSACVAVWCWAEPTRSAEVRSAAKRHLRRVRNAAR